jgi:hypothetical protein
MFHDDIGAFVVGFSWFPGNEMVNCISFLNKNAQNCLFILKNSKP